MTDFISGHLQREPEIGLNKRKKAMMTNHFSANSSDITFVFLLAQDYTKRTLNNRKVNGLHRLLVHHVLYYGFN